MALLPTGGYESPGPVSAAAHSFLDAIRLVLEGEPVHDTTKARADRARAFDASES
ncbi:hypothetical protein OG943_15595 [Amycolatopsis sp. NBC_00345]|uniref:hypothetical protein n=1 Tax=Amycolatopsis sp. NBC_00345 TaxID=2975955 RepID=UPI002E254ED7